MRKHWTIQNILHALLPAALTTMRSAKAMGQGEKFVLCRPRGGLNDTLCQIEKCWEYAERSSRTLIIDSTQSGLLTEFTEFFQPRRITSRVHTSLTDQQLKFLNTVSCYPHALRGKLDDYQAVFSSEVRNFLDKRSGVRLSFNFKKKYKETVLVHEQCGGGEKSFALLDRIVLAKKLRPVILRRTEQLSQNYVAIHVRNTDYKTEYKCFFREIYPKVAHKSLLVCSDNAAVIADARDFFDQSKIMTSSQIDYTGNKPPHTWDPKHLSEQQRKDITINALVDLIALGRANELYFTNVTKGKPSGFSTLAKHLCEHKMKINVLLGVHEQDGEQTA